MPPPADDDMWMIPMLGTELSSGVAAAAITLTWMAGHLPSCADSRPEQETLAAPADADASINERVADYYALLYKFDLTAFRGDEGPYYFSPLPNVHKSAGRMDFALLGPDTERFRPEISDVIQELSQLTGLVMTVRPEGSSEPQDSLVGVIRPALIEQMLDRPDVIERFGELRPYDGRCFALPFVDGHRIIRAMAVVPSDLPDAWIRHCLVVEITQALGLFADSDVVEPSIFSDHGPPTGKLPLNDKIIIRTLYDPRITPGMPRLEALEVAREVIEELVEGVQRKGVEALYQRPPDPLP